MSDDRIYKIGYEVIHGSFTKEQLKKAGLGGCDGIIIHSLIFPSDGSRSEMILSSSGVVESDGTYQELTDIELFKSWVHMAYQLSQSETLNPIHKHFCLKVFESVQDAVLKSRGLKS